MDKVYEVRWTLMAAEEYEETIDWLLQNRNEAVALRFIAAVTEKIKLLQSFPFMGSLSEYLPDCRKTLVLPYHLLLYRVIDEQIEIIRLFDGRQDIEKLK